MSEHELDLSILRQPDELSCGPTCLHAVYSYYGDTLPLEQVVAEAPSLAGGGTLAVMLGCHALRRGYRATLYSYNLSLLDPTWFRDAGTDVEAKLAAQSRVKTDAKLRRGSAAYAEFIHLGGELRLADLTAARLRRYLDRGIPLLAGVSATYLYRCARELGDGRPDDVLGTPQGHFVVLRGYREDAVAVADPWARGPTATAGLYWVSIDRLLTAMLLGVLTYDGNLLAIEPVGRNSQP